MKSIAQTGFVLAALAMLAGCGQQGETMQGYVEGEYVTVGSPGSGWIAALKVKEGDTVSPGTPLFALEETNERAAREAALARLEQARAQLTNLTTGKRDTEIAVIDAQIKEAEASLRLATTERARQLQLVASGTGTRQRLDTANADFDAARAKVAELKRQRDVAILPARPDEIEAARDNVAAAEATLAQAEWTLAERAVKARVFGVIEDTIRREGEFVAAASPVISILPPDAIRIRFFAPETSLPRLKPGGTVRFACDGCPEGQTARISFIATQSEYTPPVIYSVGNREKLVFKVEAIPLAPGTNLRPGQPVDVIVP
ncbi:MAG: HlyD family efflux transporter periplasmic adaptor subunit [Alphaproteobacteria bacterium]|nr:HlyD family efflux transporter periplasmic adaptor subunit [Alphaproteobacteria bacterium]